MDKRSTAIIVALIAAAVAVFFIVLFQRSGIDTGVIGTPAGDSAWERTPAEEPKDVIVTPKTVVTAKHAYRNGEHIIAGEIPLPTPCHLLESSVSVSADKKTVALALVSSVKSGEVCAQVITPARFKVTARAERSATIVATLNGQEVTLNLIEAGPNEDLDDFELYIKG